MTKNSIQTSATEISGMNNLDAVTVFFQDLGPGRGRVILECYGSAWSAYFGAMGQHNIKEFFLSAGVDYLVNKLGSAQNLKQRKIDQKHLERVIRAAQMGL